MATPNSTIAAVLNWLKKKAETSSPLDSYPIGAVYISTQPTDPASILGGGWKALNEGRVLIGANTTYPAGSKGGEASVVLSVDQMPGHSHSDQLQPPDSICTIFTALQTRLTVGPMFRPT